MKRKTIFISVFLIIVVTGVIIGIKLAKINVDVQCYEGYAFNYDEHFKNKEDIFKWMIDNMRLQNETEPLIYDLPENVYSLKNGYVDSWCGLCAYFLSEIGIEANIVYIEIYKANKFTYKHAILHLIEKNTYLEFWGENVDEKVKKSEYKPVFEFSLCEYIWIIYNYKKNLK